MVGVSKKNIRYIMKKLLLLYSWLVFLFTSFLPDVHFIMRFRGFLLSKGMKSCGRNFQVSRSCVIRVLENLSVGDDVYLAPGVVIFCHTNVTIGSEVLIGPNTIVTAGNHSSDGASYRFGPSICIPVYIGNGSWIAGNCSITAGSNIGEHVLVAANSVVVGSLNPHSIYGGVPVKLKKVVQTKD